MPDGSSREDKVYSSIRERVEDFRFDAQVADVFENMIYRSVPGYAFVLDLIGALSEKYAQPDTNCYDLGCSLGASTLKIRQHVPSSCTVIGVDSSAAMVERCRANLARDRSAAAVEIRQETLQQTDITGASIAVMNFTLQFIADDERSAVLATIARGTNPGGILILSEKVRFEDEAEQQRLTDLHHEFKRYQGYSDLEIAQKRTSLENVLVPNTLGVHRQRLRAAGYREVVLLTRCLNFVSFLAIK